MKQNVETRTDIKECLLHTLQQIRQAETQLGRQAGSVSLLAVSKTKPLSSVLAANAAGQSHFGENYVDEALAKQEQLSALDKTPEIVWHYIGAIQSNKTALIATHFDWVHGVDREKIARRLSAQRPTHLPALNCCIQVNIDNESGKAGIAPSELPELCSIMLTLPNVTLRGIMAIPAPRSDFQQQRSVFGEIRKLFDAQADLIPNLDTLSMGMSADMRAAIAEGSTMVRIGTAIFGARTAKDA